MLREMLHCNIHARITSLRSLSKTNRPQGAPKGFWVKAMIGHPSGHPLGLHQYFRPLTDAMSFNVGQLGNYAYTE